MRELRWLSSIDCANTLDNLSWHELLTLHKEYKEMKKRKLEKKLYKVVKEGPHVFLYTSLAYNAAIIDALQLHDPEYYTDKFFEGINEMLASEDFEIRELGRDMRARYSMDFKRKVILKPLAMYDVDYGDGDIDEIFPIQLRSDQEESQPKSFGAVVNDFISQST